MPFGVDKKLGGDNEGNTAWMEKCVARVQESGKSKSSAIAICKSQMRKKRTEDSSAEFDTINVEHLLRTNYVARQMAKGRTFAEAEADYEVFLAKLNFDLELVTRY